MMGEATYVVELFAFMRAWSEFLVPLILLRSPSKTPIAVGVFIAAFQERGYIDYGTLSALSLLYSIPEIVLYFLARQHLVKGMAAGGLK